MRGKGSTPPLFVFLKSSGFFIFKNPVFQKPGFLKAQKYLLVSAKTLIFEKTRSFKKPNFSSKTRVFDGSEVLAGQRKTPGFFKKPRSFHYIFKKLTLLKEYV